MNESLPNGSLISLKTSADSGSLSSALRMTVCAEMRGIDAFHRRLVQRAGQVIDNRVEQRLDALVLECASADNREHLQIDGGLANAGSSALQSSASRLRETSRAEHRRSRRSLRSAAGGKLPPSSADRPESARLEYFAPIVSSCHRIAFISIRSTTPLKFASAPIGICSATGRAPSRLRMVSRTCSKSAPFLSILFTKQIRGTLYLSPCRHTVSVCGCTPRHGIEHRHRAVENAQRTLHLGGKVHVARRIDDVDADVFPHAGGGSRRDRDAALLLLLHVIHGRRAFMHFADAVRDARIEEDALCRCRLSGVDVRHDSDVPATIQRYGASHGQFFLAGLQRPPFRSVQKLNSFRACAGSLSDAGPQLFRTRAITSGSARRPCWPQPCGARLPSSSSPRRGRWPHPAARSKACRSCPSHRGRGRR